MYARVPPVTDRPQADEQSHKWDGRNGKCSQEERRHHEKRRVAQQELCRKLSG